MSVKTESHAQRAQSGAHLAQVSHNIHSSSEDESRAALRELAAHASNDAARALIDAFRQCHWRDTKLEILRALGQNGSQRAIEFLFRVASNHFPAGHADCKDTGLCQETLLALGDTRDPLAASYLLHRLDGSPAYMKTYIINALARIPDLRAAPYLYQLMSSKECDEHPQLLRNIVVALAEMKDTSALPQLIKMLRHRLHGSGHPPDATSLTLLSAIARLSRQADDVQQFERAFEGEMLHQQFFRQCQTQVNFRSQWSLEDYLGKIFLSEQIHHSLPLELNSFAAADVGEALSIFAGEDKHFSRLCKTFSATLHVDEFITRYISSAQLNKHQASCLLDNMALQRGPAARRVFDEIERDQLNLLWSSSETEPLMISWLRALVCMSDRPHDTLAELMNSPRYQKSHERQKIEVINAFVNCCLVYQTENVWPKKRLQFITELIQNESSTLVLGRWLRALGEIGLGDLKWNDELKTKVIQTPDLHASVLLMLENEDEHQNTSLLRDLQNTLLHNRPEYTALFLRACATLRSSEKDLPSDALLKAALGAKNSDNLLAALNYLCHHPRLSCIEPLIPLLSETNGETRITVAAIVAARTLRHEKTIAPLITCLHSHNKVISGRALDALLHMEHQRANEAVIRYLVEHLGNPVVCDKVLRSLKASADGQSELADLLEKATAHTGDAALKEDLLDLAARLRFGDSQSAAAFPTADAIREIDRQLESKIVDYARLAEPIKASLRSAELPLNQPELFEATVDKSSSVVQYCKALDLTLEKEFGQKILFPKMEQQLHIFQNILHQAELDTDSPNMNLVLRYLRAERVFDLSTFPASKMTMIARSIINGKILRERTQTIDGLKAWAVLILLFSGHERLWGAALAKKDPLAFPMLAHKLVNLQDLRNPAAHRQTMLALAPLSEIRKEVFQVFSLIKKAFE